MSLYRYTYDPEVNAGYVYLREGMVARTMDLGNNVVFDLDEDRNPLGIELINVWSEQEVQRWADALEILSSLEEPK